MQCRNCGNALQPNASFCNSCGTPVSQQGGAAGPAPASPFGAPGGATMVAGSPPPGMPTGGETMMAGAPPPPGGSPFAGPPAGGVPPYGGGPTMVAGGAPGGASPYGAPPASQGYGTPPPGPGYGAPPPGGPPSYSGAAGPPPSMSGSVPPSAPYGSAPSPYAGAPNPYGAPPNPYGGASPYGPGYSTPRARAGGFNINALTGRLMRLLKFDTSVFREARADPTALIPGLVVAAVSILIMALGGWLYYVFQGLENLDSGKILIRSVLIGSLLAFGLWVGWIWLASFILTQVFKRQAPFPALLAPAGLATVPMIVGLLMLIDPLYAPFGVVALAGALQLTQIALQESTDAPAGEVFVANLAGFFVWCVILGILGDGDRGFAPGIWFQLSLDFFDVRI